MATLSGLPYEELQFSKDGKLFGDAKLPELTNTIRSAGITDLLIISHGWNNDMDDARSLFKGLVSKIAAAPPQNGKKLGVLGILWPSKKFAEKELIAGGAASVGTGRDLPLREALDNLKGFFDDDKADDIIDDAKKVVGAIEHDEQAASTFVKQMNRLFNESIHADSKQPEEDVIHSFSKINPPDLLTRLEDDDLDLQNTGASRQGAASIGDRGGAAATDFSLGGILGAAKNLLNFVTYYQMKERAGNVGVLGLNPVLQTLRQNFPSLKLHLIGHSFGGRLVTAAAAGGNGSSLTVDSLILLQAAFSHYGFASKYDGTNDGYFRSVVSGKKVNGVIMITYTRNDEAVGIAYALASRIARQIGAGLGERDDKFGGLGGNGAQITPEANNDFHLAKQIDYAFKKGNLYNLNGDGCITGHCDICKDEVGRAILSAVNAGN